MIGNDLITSECQMGDAGLKRPKPGDRDRNPRVVDDVGDFSFKKFGEK